MSAWILQSDLHASLYGGTCMAIGFVLGLYVSWRWPHRNHGQTEDR
jgi:hypothetical protein